jgi:hypothetical protein
VGILIVLVVLGLSIAPLMEINELMRNRELHDLISRTLGIYDSFRRKKYVGALQRQIVCL